MILLEAIDSHLNMVKFKTFVIGKLFDPKQKAKLIVLYDTFIDWGKCWHYISLANEVL